ncbi:DUF4105 domain-containing protein [Flavobacterium sp. 20NA77.7]|uniref:DUF4105 domain-containing protein n=1 Tax=Flavobacterium nakdongensis TaxID=3073563 RepID=A0ABY9R7X0_9FLAO|nr:DUF4105 domain-containing protein [Flavobacterium sp. 20NA77.7]WMW77360.1 DUF4105 domain-containing protein [Flavobacterium sp. 20NA77.7]
MIKKILFFFIIILNLGQAQRLSNEAKVSIITCGTAPVSYAMYGHTGIRIQDLTQQIDVVYNYGAFDFTTPHFTLKFIKGNLQYFVTRENYFDFEYNYQIDNRSIYEQELVLTTNQKQQLFDELNQSLTSEERFYTYKFIDQNCTTMVVDKINKIIGSEQLKTSQTTLNYREILYPYMSDFYQKLGIQLIFGTKVDASATRLFLPFELKKVLENNRKLSLPTRIIFEAKPSPSSFSFFNSIYSLLVLILVVIVLNKQWIQISYFTLAGLLGVFFCVVGLFSLHEEVLWNYNILLFNPLLLLYAWYLKQKKEEKIHFIGKIYLFFLLLYCILLVPKIQFEIIWPILVLHAWWTITPFVKTKN